MVEYVSEFEASKNLIFYKIEISCGPGLNGKINYAKFFFFQAGRNFFLMKKMIFTPKYCLLHSIPSFLLPFICDRSKSSRDAFSNFLLSLVALTAQYIILGVSSYFFISFLASLGQKSNQTAPI